MEFTGERVIKGMVTDDLFHEHITRYLFAAQYLKPYAGHILDVGCGTGYGSFELSKTFESITAIDISKEAIEYAALHYSAPNLTYEISDCKFIPFEHKFDAAISFEVIEHIDGVEDYLKSVKNALVPNGIFVVSTPNKKMYSDALENYENPYHIKEYYLKEFIELLRGKFNHVQIYAQDLLQGIYIRQTTNVPISTSVSFLDDHAYDPESTSFFIAICSDRELSEERNDTIFPLTQNNIIAEKDKYISALKNGVVERDCIIEHYKKESERLSLELAASIEETNKREESVQYLKNEITELNKWVESLRHEVSIRDESVKALQNEISELNKWMQILRHDGR